jgi:hypothetical protein
MKTITRISAMIFAMTMAVIFLNAQSQIQFEGLHSQGEGAAGWDTDGTGPEPYGNGHGGIYYYTASLDYVDAGSTSGGHMLDNISGFPLFAQALADNGFTPDQVTFTFGLADMGDDIEGTDWFQIGAVNYSNFYPITIRMYLAGEPMISAIGNYGIYIVGAGTQEMETGYLKIDDASSQSSDPVSMVAAAFVSDMDGEELKANIQVDFAANLVGNGRTGGKFDAFCTFTKGLPALPMQGLHADNEGIAGWNADGTGPEPYGNGHGDIVYYSASVDYDGINPSPDACLGHFLEGSTGFMNTLLQLQYRGFQIGDLKLKMGLCSLGPDVEGEDWGYENGYEWLNEYNNSFTIELNGEPILEFLQDTNKMTFINPGTVTWAIESSVGKVYDISENASPEAQYVAQSFLKDLGSHYLVTDVADISYVGPMPSINGRSGVWYELKEAAMVGVHEQATFISEGMVSGTWTAEGSPYYVNGHLEIENGDILTIEPGIKVAVRGPFHLNVQGCIKALGTADDKIVFTRSNPNLWWDGFDYVETSNTNETSVFEHCIFEYGYAQGGENGLNSGGAFAVKYFDNIEIKNSLFRYNFCDLPGYYPPSGGAIGLWNADILIQGCVFHDNYSGYGGAVFSYSHADPVISNCLFYDNLAEFGGALCYWSHSSGILINNTIVDNMALDGGGIYFYLFSNPEIINNIIWGNAATGYGNQAYFLDNNIPGFYYNDIEEGSSGFGGNFIGHYLFNIDEDPAFETSPEFPPYMLSEESPCFNMGTPDTSTWHYPQYLPQYCLCGNPRTCNGRIDMGAYELPEIVGIHDGELTAEPWHVYPNPFTEKLNIGIVLSEASEVTIEMHNLMGERVHHIERHYLSRGQHDLSGYYPELPDGVYFMTIRFNENVLTKKILKTR